jgi:uncharacterized protein (DUF983 family)
MSEKFSPWDALRNGLHRTCPHCGQGPLLDGWLGARDHCPVCGLVYQRNAGDTWAFWIIGDRIPVAMAIAVVYFGVGPHTWTQGALFFAAIAIALVATIPQRMGFVIALDYLSRRYWPDLDDPSSMLLKKERPA